MYTKTVSSPLGDIILTSDEKYLTGLFIKGQKYFLDGIKEELHENNDLEILKQTENWLSSYFAGKNPDVTKLKLKPQGTEFRKIVWQELLKIPYGKTTTYKQLGNIVAKKLGKKSMSAQAIGNAVGHNPISIIIPCHRVIGVAGALTGYAAGIEKKRFLLKLEKENYNEKDTNNIC